MSSVSDEVCLRWALSPTSSVSNELCLRQALSLMWKILEDSMDFFFSDSNPVRTSHGIVLFMDQHVGCTELDGLTSLVPRPYPAYARRREGVWCQIMRKWEQVLQLYCSKHVVRFIIQQWAICHSTLTITRLQDFSKPKDSGLWY